MWSDRSEVRRVCETYHPVFLFGTSQAISQRSVSLQLRQLPRLLRRQQREDRRRAAMEGLMGIEGNAHKARVADNSFTRQNVSLNVAPANGITCRFGNWRKPIACPPFGCF